MKTTRLLIMTISIILVAATFAGCAEVVSRTAIDTDYTAAYDAMEMVYDYEYDYMNGKWVYLPFYKNVHHDAEYRVKYKVVYSNGDVYEDWEIVDKAEYERAMKALAERSEG